MVICLLCITVIKCKYACICVVILSDFIVWTHRSYTAGRYWVWEVLCSMLKTAYNDVMYTSNLMTIYFKCPLPKLLNIQRNGKVYFI